MIEIVIDIILILSFLILLIIYNLEIALIAFTLLVSSLFFLNFFQEDKLKNLIKDISYLYFHLNLSQKYL